MKEIIKLDKIDRKILFELDKNCRITDTQLAKRVGRSREAVKYRIKQLLDKGVIEKFITSINYAKMGKTYYKIFLQLENIPAEKEKLFKFMNKQEDIHWHGDCNGNWDYIIGISTKSLLEFDEIKHKIFSKFKNLIIKKEIGVMIETRQYLKRYLTKGNQEVNVFAGEIIDTPLDKTDKKILNILANDARIPLASLAGKVKSSVKTVINKIKRLEEKGIILRYRISININKLGLGLFKIVLYYRSINKEEENKLLNYIKNIPQAIYYIEMIASWDAELEVVVEDYYELNEIIDNLREKFPEIIRNHQTVMIKKENWLPEKK